MGGGCDQASMREMRGSLWWHCVNEEALSDQALAVTELRLLGCKNHAARSASQDEKYRKPPRFQSPRFQNVPVTCLATHTICRLHEDTGMGLCRAVLSKQASSSLGFNDADLHCPERGCQ